MLTVLSPAKTLDFETPCPSDACSSPAFLAQSRKLVALLKEKSVEDIKRLMSLSDALAQLNVERYRQWKAATKPGASARPAGYAFQGDVYQGLDFASLKDRDKAYAQTQLRILSGLYGILKPLDLIEPHRLEMGTALANDKGKTLYAFWGDTQTEALNLELKTLKSNYLLNLASDEYFKSIKAKQLHATILSPRFLDSKDGKNFKIVSFYAKRARGTMARWAIQNRVKAPQDLSRFAEDGYRYDPERSTETAPAFTRDHS